jgi:hypothetical protein
VQEIKDNYDGCAYTLAEKDITGIFNNHDWNASLATPKIIELFDRRKSEYFSLIYEDIDQKDVVAIINRISDEKEMICALNAKRKEIVGAKLSEAVQEIEKLNTIMLDQKGTVAAKDKAYSELQEKLASQVESSSNIIHRLNNDNAMLSNEVSVLQNDKKEHDVLIQALRQQIRDQSDQIQELKEGACLKAPSSVDFGTPIQIIWKLDSNNSNFDDFVGLYDCDGNLIQSHEVNQKGSKSGKMTFDCPTNYGEYLFKYHIKTPNFFGMSSAPTILFESNIVKVGPTYSIVEESNRPGELTLSIQRDSGKFFFDEFTFGMYKVGGAYDEYIAMIPAKEGEHITFKPNKDEPLFNYEFRVFGEIGTDGVIYTLCSSGHTCFTQKRKRENVNANYNPFSEDYEEARSTKRKKNNMEERGEEIDMDDSENDDDEEIKSQNNNISEEEDSDQHVSDQSDDSS